MFWINNKFPLKTSPKQFPIQIIKNKKKLFLWEEKQLYLFTLFFLFFRDLLRLFKRSILPNGEYYFEFRVEDTSKLITIH